MAISRDDNGSTLNLYYSLGVGTKTLIDKKSEWPKLEIQNCHRLNVERPLLQTTLKYRKKIKEHKDVERNLNRKQI